MPRFYEEEGERVPPWLLEEAMEYSIQLHQEREAELEYLEEIVAYCREIEEANIAAGRPTTAENIGPPFLSLEEAPPFPSLEEAPPFPSLEEDNNSIGSLSSGSSSSRKRTHQPEVLGSNTRMRRDAEEQDEAEGETNGPNNNAGLDMEEWDNSGSNSASAAPWDNFFGAPPLVGGVSEDVVMEEPGGTGKGGGEEELIVELGGSGGEESHAEPGDDTKAGTAGDETMVEATDGDASNMMTEAEAPAGRPTTATAGVDTAEDWTVELWV